MPLCLALAGPAAAERPAPGLVERTFRSVDVDRDGWLNLAEFVQGLERYGRFYDWDRNRDRRIGRDEFRQRGDADFRVWDADRDGTLSRMEFNAGLYAAWDLNDDGRIARREWRKAMAAGWLGG